MKNKKSYCLLAIVITVVIALLVFVCLNFRIMRVDKVKIADDNVRAWLEEIADKEKAKSSTSELFIYIHTTRNCIVAQPIHPSTCEIGTVSLAGLLSMGLSLLSQKINWKNLFLLSLKRLGKSQPFLNIPLSHSSILYLSLTLLVILMIGKNTIIRI